MNLFRSLIPDPTFAQKDVGPKRESLVPEITGTLGGVLSLGSSVRVRPSLPSLCLCLPGPEPVRPGTGAPSVLVTPQNLTSPFSGPNSGGLPDIPEPPPG